MHQRPGEPLLPGPLRNGDPQQETPAGKTNFATDENVLRDCGRKKYDGINHAWCFWPLHSPVPSLSSSPNAVAAPSLSTSSNGKNCHLQINLVELIILAPYCSWGTPGIFCLSNNCMELPKKKSRYFSGPGASSRSFPNAMQRLEVESKYRDYATL